MRRPKVLVAVVIVALALVSLNGTQVFAFRWYAGNDHGSAKGVKADIYTPSSEPYIDPGPGDYSGTANWVSILATDYVQTGWVFRVIDDNARPYVEHEISGNYGIDYYGTQSWNTSKNYKLYFDGYATWWAAIDGDNKGGFGPLAGTQEVGARSEVCESDYNELDTDFDSVYYRDSNYNWNLFDEGNWIENSPYDVQKDQYYDYRGYGP